MIKDLWMKYLLLSLLLSTSSFAEDYMLFSVENFWMNQETINTPLSGEIKAKKMLLLFDSERIEIEPEPGDIFEADVFMKHNMINFKKGYISFSSDLGSRNPLIGVNDFNITNSDVEFTKDAISIDGESLDLTLDGIDIGLKNVSLICDTGGIYTTEIDDVCLRNSSLRSNNEAGITTLVIKDLDSDFPLELEMFIRELFIKDDNIRGLVQNINGVIKGTHYNMEIADINCYKYKDQRDIDPELIINGCMKTSKNTFKNFSMQKKDVMTNIGNAHMTIEEDSYLLVSDKSTFKVGNEVTHIHHLEINCEKKPLPKGKNVIIDEHVVLEGCLDRGDVRISRIQVDEDKARKFLEINAPTLATVAKEMEQKGLIDIYDFKDIKLTSANKDFAFKAKIKFIFRIPVRFRGKAGFDKDKNELKLDLEAAHVAGIPTRKLLLYLLQKFISSEDIQVDGNSLTIKM